jgi:hypothetical protein
MAELGAIPLALSLLVWTAKHFGRRDDASADIGQAVVDGVLGNAAHVSLTALVETATRKFRANTLPTDAQFVRASCQALRKSTLWVLEHRHSRRSAAEVVKDFKQYASETTDYDGFIVRALACSPDKAWYRAFARALASEKFEAWHAQLVIPEADVRLAFQPSRCDLQDFLIRSLLDFARREVRQGEAPADFGEQLASTRETAGGEASSIAEAYCAFWRCEIHSHPELLNAFLVEQLEPLHPMLRALAAQLSQLTEQLAQDRTHSRSVAEAAQIGGFDVSRHYRRVLDLLPEPGFRREWFEQQFEAWVGDAMAGRAPPYLVLQAGPQFGKSWLAASILRSWQSAGHKVAYHAFRRNEGFVSPTEAYRSLGRQLCELHGLPPSRCESQRDFIEIIDAVTVRQRDRGLAGTLVIVDGLDEAFGPGGRLPIDAQDFLPELSHREEPVGVVFLVTLRPEFGVLWSGDARRCRMVRLPNRQELVDEVGTALTHLCETRREAHEAIPPAHLLPEFARAADGQLGAACDIFLRAGSEAWDRWEQDLGAIPQGVIPSMLGLWSDLQQRGQQRGLDHRDLTWVCTLLALAKEPLTFEQLTLLDDLALREPYLDHRPLSLTRAGANAKLPDILQHCACLFAEPDGERPRRFGFRHSIFAELVQRVGGVDSDHLPAEDVVAFAAHLFGYVGLTEWSRQKSPLRGYALRHALLHLDDVEEHEALLSLIATPGFLDSLEALDPDRPDLHLEALGLGAEVLCAQGFPTDCAELLALAFLHSSLSEQSASETPLQALEAAGIARAAGVIGRVRNPNRQFLQVLIVAIKLEEQGRRGDATAWLQRAGDILPSFAAFEPDTQLAGALLRRLATLHPADSLALAMRVLPDSQLKEWMKGCDRAALEAMPQEKLRACDARLAESAQSEQHSLQFLLADIAQKRDDMNADRLRADAPEFQEALLLVLIAGARGQTDDLCKAREAVAQYGHAERHSLLRLRLIDTLCRFSELDEARSLAVSLDASAWQFRARALIARHTRFESDIAAARLLFEADENLRCDMEAAGDITDLTGDRQYLLEATARSLAAPDHFDPAVGLSLLRRIANKIGPPGHTAAAYRLAHSYAPDDAPADLARVIAARTGRAEHFERAYRTLPDIFLPEDQFEFYLRLIRVYARSGHRGLALTIAEAMGIPGDELERYTGSHAGAGGDSPWRVEPELESLLSVARQSQRPADFRTFWVACTSLRQEMDVSRCLLEAAADIKPYPASDSERRQQWVNVMPDIVLHAMDREDWLMATLPALLVVLPEHEKTVHDVIAATLTDARTQAG